MIQYRQLQYFLAVAKELNFHSAAHLLNITQPPLSHAIKKLEAEIGTPLFIRSKRSILLTPAGKALYKRAPGLISAANAAVSDIKSIGQGQKGQVHIGYNSSIMLTAIVDLVKKFKIEHPDISIQLTQLSSDKQIAAVERHEIDMGFVDVEMISPGNQYSLLNHKLATSFRLVAALPISHLLAKEQTLNYLDIANERHIILARHLLPSLHDKIISVCQTAGFSPNVNIYARQLPEVLGLVAAGYGVAIAPDCAIPGWSHSVKFAKFERDEFIDVYAITNKDTENSSMKKLLEMLPFQHNYS